MSMSLDGKSSTTAREPAQFTSRADKRLLLELRARADAVMAGAGTVASDRMSLSVPDSRLQRARVRRGRPAHPLRVIVSGTLASLSPGLKVFAKKVSPVVIFCSARAPESRRRRFSRHADVRICGGTRVDLRKACSILQSAYGVRHLHAEGGADLNGALLDADLIDELDLTLAGVVFGGRDAPTIMAGRGRTRIQGALAMKLVSVRLLGAEVFLRYVRKGRRRPKS